MSITAVLNNPATVFYEGSGVSSDVPDLLPISIGGHPYLVDLREYERTTVDALRPASDQSAEPGDQSLSNIGIWKRKGIDWRLGAGQIFFDDELAVQSRFRVSKGVYPWDPNKLSLQKATDQKRSSANTNLELLPVLGFLYVVDGNEVYHSADPSVDSPTWTSATIHVAEGAVAVNSICSDGSNVYAALGTNGIHKTVHGASTSTHFSDYQATLVHFSNGRLLAAKAGEVVEISSAGVASAPALSHFNPNAQVIAMCASPTGIYVAVNVGDTAEFYFIGFNAATGALAPAISAGQLPSGETVNAMTYYGGLKALGTSRGLRLAIIVQDRGLDPQPVIEDFGAVSCIHGRGEFVYFGVTNLDSVSTGIGRADLSRFPGLPGVPAYATDLMAGETGSVVQGSVQSVATFAGKRYFAVSGDGIWGEHQAGNLVAEGRISSGLIRFTSTEKKVVTHLDLRHEPLNGTIEGNILLEDMTSTSTGLSTVQGSLAPPSALTANQAESEFPELELVLRRSATDVTKGPVLKRWALRAIVVPMRTDAIVLPLLVKTKVNAGFGEGQDYPMDPLDEFLFLKGLEAQRRVVILQEGEFADSVVVDQVRVKPEKWMKNRRWYEGHVYVRLLSMGPVTQGV